MPVIVESEDLDERQLPHICSGADIPETTVLHQDKYVANIRLVALCVGYLLAAQNGVVVATSRRSPLRHGLTNTVKN